MANISINENNIVAIEDPEYNDDDELISNKNIDLLGDDNKDRIDIISANSNGFYVAGNDGVISNIQYVMEKKNKTASICQLIQSFILPTKKTRVKSLALSRHQDFMCVLTNNSQILKVNVELGSSEVYIYNIYINIHFT